MELCQTLEALRTADDAEVARQQFVELIDRWEQSLESGTEPVADDLRARFETARVAVEARLTDLEAARARVAAETAARAAARAAAVASRRQLCDAVERLDAEASDARLAELQHAWTALTPLDGDREGDALQRRFGYACASWAQRRAAWVAAVERGRQLEAILTEMERLAASGERNALRTRWGGLHKEWLALTGAGPVQGGEALRQRFALVEDRRRELDAAARAERERQEQENLARLQQLCDHTEQLARAQTLDLKDAERTMRTLRTTLDNLDSLPSKRDRDAITRRLRALHTELLGRARELRELADWQRWANVGIQEELCQRLEALGDVESVSEVARQFRDILARWRQAADAPREESAPLRVRFKQAYDRVYPRCATYFAELAAQRKENLQRKTALCEEAERLATSSEWIKTAQRITEIQAEWKSIGPVPRQQQKELWNRLRAASSQFFARRKADLAQRKKEWAQNLERKEALCVRVEALLEPTDWETAVREVKQIQAEWKTVGPVRRNRSETIWQRVRAACDQFFARYQQRDQAVLAEKLAQREALCVELEALLASGDEQAPELATDVVERVRDIRARWRQAPELPRERARGVFTRFNAALGRLLDQFPERFRGTDLDPNRNRQGLERLCERVEALLAEAREDTAASPAEILARKWREALAANMMGARVDEDARRRSAIEEVRRVQAERRKIGPIPGETGRILAARFQHACDLFFRQIPNAPQRPGMR